MRRLGDCGIHGSAVISEGKTGVALVAAGDGVYRLEDRDVDDCHCTARPPGPKLLAEDPALAGCYGHVVESTGIDGELIPMVEASDRIGSGTRRVSRPHA